MSEGITFTWEQSVLDSDILESNTKYLLLALRTYMNQHGNNCFPSIESLSKRTKLSKPTICKHIALAIKHGFLKKKLMGFAGQRWALNHYTPIFPLTTTYCGKTILPPSPEGSKAILPPYPEGGKTDSKKVVKWFNTNNPVEQTNNNITSYSPPKGEGAPSEDNPPPTHRDRIDYKDMMETWHHWQLPKVKVLHPQRKEKLAKLFREQMESDPVKWEDYCEKIFSSPFLRGNNNRGWRADFDWALKLVNYAKVMEGKYDDKPGAKG